MRPSRSFVQRSLAAVAAHRAASLLTLLMLVALALSASPRGAIAQIFNKKLLHPFLCSPACPNPTASISPGTESTTSSTVAVTITLCDSTGFSGDSVVLNGANVTSSFTQTSGTSSPGCNVKRLLTKTVTLNPGANTLAAYVWQLSQSGSKAVTYTYTPPTFGLTVTVSPTTLDAVAGQGYTTTFTVTNTGNASHAYSFFAGCKGTAIAVCGTESLSSATIPAGGDTTVTLSWTAATAGVARGWVSMTADDGTNNMNMATEQVTEFATGLDVVDANPGASFNRANCLVVAASAHVANECGDLRITHPLPAVRSYNKVRAPTLVYSWRFATPGPNIGAFLTVAASTRLLDSVVGVLHIWPHNNPSATLIAQSQTWYGADWHHDSVTTTRRIALEFGGYFSPSGYYDYAFATTRYYNTGGSADSVKQDSSASHFVHVNRWISPYGSGWWLAGYEQLFLYTDGVAWIGGDGSTQWYAKHVSTDSVFYPQTYVFERDSIIYHAATTSYTRYAHHGVQVVYNNLGQHLHTIDRLGFTTAFWVNAQNRIDSIWVPQPSGHFSYAFAYSGDAGVADTALTSVTAPGSRTVTFHDTLRVSGASKSPLTITDPDGKATTFTYDLLGGGQTRALSRKDKRGTLATFGFGVQGEGLGFDSIALAGTGPDIRHKFSAQNNLGQSAHAANPDSLYIEIDGPRKLAGGDSADVTRIWIDRWWQPLHIRDAHGSDTYIARLDTLHPANVTRVQDPLGRIYSALYDTRGNDSVVTDFGTYLSGTFATTTYRFDPKWDFVSFVNPPAHDSVTLHYDSTTGNEMWQQDARGTTSRVTMGYDAGLKLLASVTDARGKVDSINYDGVLANPTRAKSPLGFITTTLDDGLGRDTLITSPVDSAQTKFAHVHKKYDTMSRDSVTFSYGPAMNGVVAESLTVTTLRDAEGAPLTVARKVAPDPASIGTLTTTYKYDAAGRTTSTCPVDTTCDVDTLDAAGNVRSTTDRRGLAVRMVYDALERLVKRTTDSVVYTPRWSPNWVDEVNPPGGYPQQDTLMFPHYTNRPNKKYVIAVDTAVFAYDALGRTVKADNRDARVHRTYNLDGTLALDSLYVRTVSTHDTLYRHTVGSQTVYDSVNVDSESVGDFTTHQYGLASTYDIARRRVTLQYPANLMYTVGGTAYGTVTYGYDAATGALTSVTDMFGHVSHYYDGLSNDLDSLNLPGQLHQTFKYDGLDRLISDSLITRATTDTAPTVWHTDPIIRATTIHYDARGKVTSASNSHTIMDALVATYTGLGQVDSTHFAGGATDANGVVTTFTNDEWSQVDGFGNKLASHATTSSSSIYTTGFEELWLPGMSTSASGGTTFSDTLTYAATTGRQLTYSNLFVGSTLTLQRDTDLYDASGNQIYVDTRQLEQTRAPSYAMYSADGKLRAIDSRSLQEAINQDGAIDWYKFAFEQYRYDALGRRVWVRSRKICHLSYGDCFASTTRRIIWDGSGELVEISALGDSLPQGANFLGSPALWESDTAYVDSLVQTPTYTGTGSGVDLDEFYGRTVYVAGRDAEHPLEVVRLRYAGIPLGCSPVVFDTVVYIPSYNYRGVADNGSLAGGTYALGPFTDCNGHRQVAAPPWWGAYSQWVHGNPSYGWFGSVLAFRQDASGLTFSRNRYYDSRAGRFTQEDPIGLAGGMNAYGFATGDPVNYSDPFGLCPPVDATPCVAGTENFSEAAFQSIGKALLSFQGPAEIYGDAVVLPLGGGEEAAEQVAVKVTAPAVSDSKLGNIIADLFKGTRTSNPIGSGTTADAIRFERLTGQAVGGKFHTQKGTEYLKALDKWITKSSADATHYDRLVAHSVREDLASALAGH